MRYDEKISGIVNITEKPSVRRSSTASGRIRLRPSTIKAISSGQLKKGDALSTARLAAVWAVKDTPRLIPLCHSIPITGVDVEFELGDESLQVTVTVTSVGQTGVEMESLSGVTAALLNIWDMTKYLEKDEMGNYPDTVIDAIRVIEKIKENI